MMSWGLVFRGLGLSALLLGAVACSAATDETPAPEPTGDTEQAAREQICPQIAILCVEGHHVKYGPNCKQTCVPDKPTKRDCNPACGAGEYCAECKTTSGSAFVCLPDGAAC